MLETIEPSCVSTAATRTDIADALLFPEEEAAVACAVERRRREFATGRACARAALEPWGLSRHPIPVRSSGAPRWPDGIAGSITHCDGYRGCAVARTEDLIAIGVDAEPNEPLPNALLPDIAVAKERDLVRRLLRDAPPVRWDRLLFCMKEAVYKAWFPLTGQAVAFGQAVVSIDPRSGSFTVRVAPPGPRRGGRSTALSGNWLARDGILLAAVALPRRVVR